MYLAVKNFFHFTVQIIITSGEDKEQQDAMEQQYMTN